MEEAFNFTMRQTETLLHLVNWGFSPYKDMKLMKRPIRALNWITVPLFFFQRAVSLSASIDVTVFPPFSRSPRFQLPPPARLLFSQQVLYIYNPER